MIKQYLLLVIIVLSFSRSIAQSWRSNLEMARKYYAAKDYPNAYKTYQLVAKQLPKNIRLDAEIGQAAYKAGDFSKASSYFAKQKKAVRTKKARLNHNLGNAYMQQKNYEKAIDAYKESLRNNPNDEQTRYNLALAKQKNKTEQKNSLKNDKNKQEPKQNSPKNDKPKTDQKDQQQKPEAADKRLKQSASDRMLDDLMKRELDTKQKHKGKPNKNASENGKDW